MAKRSVQTEDDMHWVFCEGKLTRRRRVQVHVPKALTAPPPCSVPQSERGTKYFVSQNTPVWLEQTSKATVRASAAGAICGHGQYKRHGSLEKARYVRLPIYAEDRADALRCPLKKHCTTYGHLMEDLIVQHVYEPVMRFVTGDSGWKIGEGFFYGRDHISGMPDGFSAIASPDGDTLTAFLPNGPEQQLLTEIKAAVGDIYANDTEKHHTFMDVKVEHLIQMQHQMWVTGAMVCDYVAYSLSRNTCTMARVWRSPVLLDWMQACYRQYDTWIHMDVDELESIPQGDIQYMPVIPDLETSVYIRPFSLIYGGDLQQRMELDVLLQNATRLLRSHMYSTDPDAQEGWLTFVNGLLLKRGVDPAAEPTTECDLRWDSDGSAEF